MYICKNPNISGAYPAPQSNPGPGLLPLTDEQVAMVIQYNGFVTITKAEDGITVEPNTEAWEAWKAEHHEEPAPYTPTLEERITALELAQLYSMGVTSNV